MDYAKYFIASFLGVISGIFIHLYFFGSARYLHLTFNRQVSIQIDPTNLLSILITSILGIVVLRSLSLTDKSERVEKDILIGFFAGFESKFSEDIHRLSSSGEAEGADVASSFQKHGMLLQELTDLAKTHASINNEQTLPGLEKAVSDLRGLFQTVPLSGEVEDGVRVEGTKIMYSSRHIAEITASMGRFKKALFNVIVDINRRK